MMRALLAKELRALRPLACCLAGMFTLILLYVFATELPDAQRLDPANWLRDDRSGAFVMLMLFGSMIGAGLLIQEGEQGTLRFLDGLPLSRSRLFIAKVLAAFAVIALVPVLGLSMDTVLGRLSRSSVDAPFPWTFVFAQLGLQMLAGVYLVALALVLSFLRKWFALAAGLLFFGSVLAQQHGIPWIALFDPYQMLGVGLDGARVLVSWRQVLAPSAATLVLLAVAWSGFLHLGDRAQFASERFRRLRFLCILGHGLKLLAPVVWIAAIVYLVGDTGRRQAVQPATMPLGESAFSRRETQHYEFLFRSAQREEAEPLLGAADEIHEQVAGFLGGTPPPARIVVDLASPILPHAAGMTNWTKIRMPLDLGGDFAERRRILGHETAHVFIEQLSGGRLSGHFNNIRFLHEGLATHLELELFAGPRQRAQQRRAVAGAWSRGRIPFELLSENGALSRTRDPMLVYPLGEVFARELVAAHGSKAPARLLRAFARDDAPSGLKDAALWRDVMQSAGLSLDQVVAGYETTCAAMAAQEKGFVERLPRLSAAVVLQDSEIVIKPIFSGHAPGEMVCVIETSEPFGPPIRVLSRQKDGNFTFARSEHASLTVRYLLGWRTPTTPNPIFEPWADAAIK